MKKIILFSAAIALCCLAACQKKEAMPKMANDVDSLSYELGLANTIGIQNYFQQMGIDSANIEAFLKGFKDGVNSGDDKEKEAYYAGVQSGMQVRMRAVPYVENQIFAGDSTKHLNEKLFMQGFMRGVKKGAIFITKGDTLVEYAISRDLEERMNAIGEENLRTANPDKIKAAEDFMAAKANEEGIQKLANGVLYKVIKEGNGVIATADDTCVVEYEGKLADGTVFDATNKQPGGKPLNMRPRQTVPGFQEALIHMPVGSIWEIYIPYEQAYGARGNNSIPGFAPLTFRVQLNEVKKYKKPERRLLDQAKDKAEKIMEPKKQN